MRCNKINAALATRRYAVKELEPGTIVSWDESSSKSTYIVTRIDTEHLAINLATGAWLTAETKVTVVPTGSVITLTVE